MEIGQVFPTAKDIAENALGAIRDLVYLPRKPLGKNFSVQLPKLDGEVLNLCAEDTPRPRRWFQFWKSSAAA